MNQPQELHKIAEGREAEIFAWEDGNVLRLLRNPNAQQQVEWEAQAMKAARAAGVSVPAVHGTTTVQERPGLVMERIDGPDQLTLLTQRPWLLFRAARLLGEVHAQLHETEAPDSLSALKASHKRRIESSDQVPPHLAEFAVAELEKLPDGDRLCHGDYHPANLLMTNGAPVVIDWTNVTRGDPAADVARTLMLLRLGEPPPGTPAIVRLLTLVGRRIMLSGYLRAYRRRPVDMGLIDRWEVPIVAVRLTEKIESERPALLRILEKRGAAAG